MIRFTERRREHREYHKAPVLVQELDDIYIYNARMVNYNYQGVYFESDTAFEVGTNIILGIEGSTYISPSASPDSPNFYHAKILWNRQLTGNMFNFGFGTQFVYINDKQKLFKTDSMLMEENRKHSRKRCAKPIILCSNNKRYSGLISNIGRSGAFIDTQAELKKGQPITLVLPITRKGRRLVIKGEVLHSGENGAGLRFRSITEIKQKQSTKQHAGGNPLLK